MMLYNSLRYIVLDLYKGILQLPASTSVSESHILERTLPEKETTERWTAIPKKRSAALTSKIESSGISTTF